MMQQQQQHNQLNSQTAKINISENVKQEAALIWQQNVSPSKLVERPSEEQLANENNDISIADMKLRVKSSPSASSSSSESKPVERVSILLSPASNEEDRRLNSEQSPVEQSKLVSSCSARSKQLDNERSQRQLELLQMLRQTSTLNSCNSQELPTLQQLQQQIQLRKQQQQQQSPVKQQPATNKQAELSAGKAAEQLRMQEWTEAAALMLQQRQQQQQQQQQRAAQQPVQLCMLGRRSNQLETDPRARLEEPQLHNNNNNSTNQQPESQTTTPELLNQNQNLKPDNDCTRQTLLTTTREDSQAMSTRTSQQSTISLVEPVPSPRLQSSSARQSSLPVQQQLSILTSTSCGRVKDLNQSSLESAQSTPSTSVLSDSATLITESRLENCSELIPKLIQRLDRKLAVMKEEQLTLMRECELNESTGQRLFQSMKLQLTPVEFDKISVHTNEIEKVTKLIQSLNSRLKKVEAELSERQKSPKSNFRSSISSNQQLSQPAETENTSRNQTTATSLQARKSSNLRVANNSQLANTVRGVSDPTSTTGLPKRLHQHHASLQPTQSSQLNEEQQQSSHEQDANQHQHQHQSSISEEKTKTKAKGKPSSSSDSIFDSADSAIGSALNGHCGSSSNIIQQGANASQSSLSSSTHSSLSSSDSPNVESNSQSHLSSSSISMLSSESSSCSSPALVSPASSSCLTSSSSSSKSDSNNNNNNNNNECQAQPNIQSEANKWSADESKPAAHIDILVAKRNKLIAQLEEANLLEECIVRRNSIIIQRILSKYYQSEEIDNDDDDDHENSLGEIAQFRQFTRLKSLLLKDTHEVADRIDNAELQLSRLKQFSLTQQQQHQQSDSSKLASNN